jgi:hypothetical protein
MVVVSGTFEKSSLIETPDMPRLLSPHSGRELRGASCISDGGDEFQGVIYFVRWTKNVLAWGIQRPVEGTGRKLSAKGPERMS